MNSTLLGAAWMGGAILSFTAMAIAGRAVSFELDTFEIMLFRSVVGFAIVLAVARFAGTLHQVNREQLGLHGFRNLAHFTGQNLWFYAITVIPLAQVFALEFTGPIWVIIFTPLLLRERLASFNVIAAVIGFIGILIVTRPAPETLSWGVVAAASAAIFFALTALMTRKLTRTQPITCILFYLTLMQGVFGIVAAGYDGDIALPSIISLPWLMLIACAGLLAHFCMTKALSIAPATVVMPVDFIRLPLIAVVGVMIYDEPIDLYVILGALLIFAANYFNIWKSAHATQ